MRDSRYAALLFALLSSTLIAEPLHPWRPPFGLDRVGTDLSAAFSADAVAEPDTMINPVDLGCVLVPHDWLLLGPGQRTKVRVAVFSRDREQRVQVATWLATAREEQSQAQASLSPGARQQLSLTLAEPGGSADRDILHVAITQSDGRELFHKQITTMLVRTPPAWPRFGATQTLLRYDAPISLRDPHTGDLSTMPYDRGWDAQLKDVVISLPDGSRFVFWRGASYVPFWASPFNTGLSYEWAETGPLPDGFVDSVEPLMDKELRYGRVEIVESTAARVHVRWTYQSTDFQYKTWGDLATEDFIFYPDGFGTRVLTLKSGLNADYELSEFIILTPQEAYPLDVLPRDLVRAVFLDGATRTFEFPFTQPAEAPIRRPRDVPAVWRVRLNGRDPRTAIYFSPLDKIIPPCIFGPFRDKGQIVTPAYWGSHWPLARGNTTGGAINDRVHVTPSHNSLMSWARQRPTPLATATMPSIDTLGHARTMRTQQWAWLIGMTDEGDDRLLDRARSYGSPPSLQLTGARTSIDSYALQRRAIQLVVENAEVTVEIRPTPVCVNPVFELLNAPRRLQRITLADRELSPAQYAWDGHVLWLNVRIDEREPLQLSFAE